MIISSRKEFLLQAVAVLFASGCSVILQPLAAKVANACSKNRNRLEFLLQTVTPFLQIVGRDKSGILQRFGESFAGCKPDVEFFDFTGIYFLLCIAAFAVAC